MNCRAREAQARGDHRGEEDEGCGGDAPRPRTGLPAAAGSHPLQKIGADRMARAEADGGAEQAGEENDSGSGSSHAEAHPDQDRGPVAGRALSGIVEEPHGGRSTDTDPVSIIGIVRRFGSRRRHRGGGTSRSGGRIIPVERDSPVLLIIGRIRVPVSERV